MVLDLTKCGEGKLVVAPKKDKLAQSVNMVLKRLADGELSPSEASVLAGRITFLQSSVCGRTASVAMDEVRGRANQRLARAVLVQELRSGLE